MTLGGSLVVVWFLLNPKPPERLSDSAVRVRDELSPTVFGADRGLEEKALPPAALVEDRRSVQGSPDSSGELPVVPTDLILEEKYKDFHGVELIGAAKGFQLLYHDRADQILEEMMADGRYTSELVEDGVEFGPSTHRGMWPGNRGPTEMIRAIPLGDGLSELQRAYVFPSDHPDLTALDVERSWLWEKAAPFVE